MLFEQIQSNKRKTFLVMFGYMVLFVLIGAAIGYLYLESAVFGMGIAVVVGLIYSAIMVSQSTAFVMSLNHARELHDNNDYPKLWNICEEMALIADVPMPRVFVIDDPTPNAFATGISPESAAVAATTGLLERLNREELEGVMAHEFAHIRNYDIRLSTIAYALAGAIVLLTNMAYRFFWFGGGGRSRRRSSDRSSSGSGALQLLLLLGAIVLIVLGPFIATLMRLALSRNREYLADATAVEFTRNPQGLIHALQKIANSPASKVADRASASLYFSNPFREGEENERDSLFSTHPATSNRIRRLSEM